MSNCAILDEKISAGIIKDSSSLEPRKISHNRSPQHIQRTHIVHGSAVTSRLPDDTIVDCSHPAIENGSPTGREKLHKIDPLNSQPLESQYAADRNVKYSKGFSRARITLYHGGII